MLVNTFENVDNGMFYSGCIIAEIRDYRISAGPDFFDTKYVLLHPSHQVGSFMLYFDAKFLLVVHTSLVSKIDLEFKIIDVIDIKVVRFCICFI